MSLRDIPNFEKNGLKINLYAFEKNSLYPAYLTKLKLNVSVISLLLLTEKKDNTHYYLIKSFDRVMKTLLRSERTAKSKTNIRKFVRGVSKA